MPKALLHGKIPVEKFSHNEQVFSDRRQSMAPKKQVDQVANRLANEEALKQTVEFAALVSGLKETMPEKADVFDGYLAKYNDGMLKAAAAYLLCKQVVGGEKMKATFEKLVPGYTHEWSVRSHATPPPSQQTPHRPRLLPTKRTAAISPRSQPHITCETTCDALLTVSVFLARRAQAFSHEHPLVI